MIRTFATLTLALPAFAAMAQNTDYSALYDKCVESNGPINNTVVHMCSESVSTKAKAEMNKLYKQVYERLSQQSADDADKLERTQKSWLAYRNGQCELAGSHVGSPMYDFCPMQLNVQRVAELRELAGQ